MNIRVNSLKAAGGAYARLRRQRGLAPYKGKASVLPGVLGPVRVICGDLTYTLMLDGMAATADK